MNRTHRPSQAIKQRSATDRLAVFREARELITLANEISAEVDEGLGRFQIYGDDLRLARALQQAQELSSVAQSIRNTLLELRGSFNDVRTNGRLHERGQGVRS